MTRGGKRHALADHARSELEFVNYQHGDAPGLSVRGEIDIAGCPGLALALDAAVRESRGAFVLDFADLEYLDSSGLSLVLRARATLAREDRDLAIVCPPGPVRRLIDVAGVADLFHLYASCEEANAALVPRAQ